jgi:2'-5' RNA ligase
VRLFLAINLDAAARAAVVRAAEPLHAAAPSLPWVPDARLHLTLKFLGEQPPELVPRLSAVCDAVAARLTAFGTTLGEFGAFPNFRRPRVVWIGMDADPRLEILHHDVELAAESLGFPLEGRPFRPHVTLARVAHALDTESLRALQRAARRAARVRIAASVGSIDLMQSTLRPDGAAYELLHSSPLGVH